ncbi:hypothetical protein [Methylibium rhizosphaerae]|uniref:hypothetical protein n=1 Tax=Methylibium rhizosphaerae TaxID=2570323 RepID=UPI00112BA1AE|nr:hypothetical protein [Methylibium rhizosphaerae]
MTWSTFGNTSLRLWHMTVLRCASWVVLSALLALQVACASGAGLVDHSFEFNAVWDSPDIEVLSYRYGTSEMTNSKLQEQRYGIANQGAGVNGPMLRGEDLYVKWRVKATGQVYEDTADLRDKLPADLTGHRIYFVVRNTQLYVYLITPKRRAAGDPPSPLRKFSHLKVLPLHPNTSN